MNRRNLLILKDFGVPGPIHNTREHGAARYRQMLRDINA
jgi:hypothetical protein